MPRIDLSDDELAALLEAVRRFLDDDKFPLAPRLLPLRIALAKLDAASDEPASVQRPRENQL